MSAVGPHRRDAVASARGSRRHDPAGNSLTGRPPPLAALAYDSAVDPFTVPTTHWHRLDDGRVQCDLCPRECRLHEGQRGLCFVRARRDDAVVLTSYGRSSGFCVDPIEKKPLNHFLP